MYHGLSKKYNTAKIEYSNDVASGAITRYKSFDTLINRSIATGETVSATTLVTDEKPFNKSKKKGGNKDKSKDTKDKNKDKSKPSAATKTKYDSSKGRPCKHCNGAHWDNECTSVNPKPTKSNGGRKSDDEPSSEEIDKVARYVRQQDAKKAATLATQRKQDDEKEYEYNLLSAYYA